MFLMVTGRAAFGCHFQSAPAHRFPTPRENGPRPKSEAKSVPSAGSRFHAEGRTWRVAAGRATVSYLLLAPLAKIDVGQLLVKVKRCR